MGNNIYGLNIGINVGKYISKTKGKNIDTKLTQKQQFCA
jgi:hypothetical protein